MCMCICIYFAKSNQSLNLGMLRPGNMEEKRHLVVALVPAHVARIRILKAVIAHVNCIHDHVTEYDLAEMAGELVAYGEVALVRLVLSLAGTRAARGRGFE